MTLGEGSSSGSTGAGTLVGSSVEIAVLSSLDLRDVFTGTSAGSSDGSSIEKAVLSNLMFGGGFIDAFEGRSSVEKAVLSSPELGGGGCMDEDKRMKSLHKHSNQFQSPGDTRSTDSHHQVHSSETQQEPGTVQNLYFFMSKTSFHQSCVYIHIIA